MRVASVSRRSFVTWSSCLDDLLERRELERGIIDNLFERLVSLEAKVLRVVVERVENVRIDGGTVDGWAGVVGRVARPGVLVSEIDLVKEYREGVELFRPNVVEGGRVTGSQPAARLGMLFRLARFSNRS